MRWGWPAAKQRFCGRAEAACGLPAHAREAGLFPGEGSVICVSQMSGDAGQWRDLPPAPPPHGSFLAWYQGCRCDACEASGQGFLHELARRNLHRREGDEPYAVRLSADDRAHLDPAVRARNCPVCGALRHHRCRDPHFPLHFSATHPERGSS